MLLGKTASILAIAVLPVFLVTTGLRLVTNSPWLYQHGFSAYEAPSRTGLSMEQLLSAAEQTRRYFNSEEEPLRVTIERGGEAVQLYNEREVAHMADVKGLFRLARRVEELSSGYLLGFMGLGLWLLKRRFLMMLLDTLVQGGLVTVGLVLLVGAGALLDFDRLFLQFHLVTFTNDLWQLNPHTDRLIQMYPAEFFRDATLAIGALTLLAGGVLAGLAGAARPPASIPKAPDPA